MSNFERLTKSIQEYIDLKVYELIHENKTFALSSSLSKVATTGFYDDLLRKPNILDIESIKKELAEVASTGEYSDLNGLPDIPNAENILDAVLKSITISAVGKSGKYGDLIDAPNYDYQITEINKTIQNLQTGTGIEEIQYISPTTFEEFVDMISDGGIFYVLSRDISIEYDGETYSIIGLYDVRIHSNGINCYGFNKMHQFIINPDTKQLVYFTSFTKYIIDKIPSDASKLNIVDEKDNFTSTNVEGALAELFQFASNGKSLIANAITGKGVNTLATDTFAQMASNINAIQGSVSAISGQNALNKCGSKKFRFAVFSDVHVYTDDTKTSNIKLKEAIAKVEELGCEFIAITGDLCNYDVENELNQYKSLIDANANIPVYEIAGNHDATQQGLNTTLWKTITEQEPYYEVIHKDDVFLFLSQYQWADNSVSGMLPQEYRDWLSSKLEEHKTKNRIFFFFHQYMPDCEGFGYRNGTQNQSYLKGTLEFFTNLINTYKNVIWFSGHSHTAFSYQTDYPNCIAYNKNGEICTLLHVPTLQGGEYYIVDVYEHLVEVEGYKNGIPVDGIYYAIDDYIYVSPIEGIVLDKSTLNFANTDSQTIVATVTPSSQQNLLVWETSDSNVATVIDGVVTPVGNGSCVITARCGDKSASCNITVDIVESELYYSINSTLNGCTLSNTDTRIKDGETYIATITEGANTTINTVTVKMSGVDITNTAYNNSNKTIGIDIVTGNIEIIVEVNKLTTGISLNQSAITFNSTIGTARLIATLIPSDAVGTIEWSSDNENIATVVNGLVTVTATTSGSCTITASCNGHSATCTVTVNIRTKTVAYSKDSRTVTLTGAKKQANIDNDTTSQLIFDTPLKANTRYYMKAESLKFEDGTDVDIPTDKIYIIGSPWVVGADKQATSKINCDYSDFVNTEVPLTNGYGNNQSTIGTYDITKYGDIEKITGFCIKASSSSPVTLPVTVTLTGFEIYTYGETF